MKVLPKVHSWAAFAHPKAPYPRLVRTAARSIQALQARGELKNEHVAHAERQGLVFYPITTTIH